MNSINVKAQEEVEEEYYFLEDEYAENYDENYFEENALKINEINNMIVENNQELLSKQDIDKEIDPFQLLTSESRIAFVMPSFTMAAYDFSFYHFFMMHSDIKAGEFVTSDVELLSANVPTIEESFNNHKSFGLHQLREYTSELLPNADLHYLSDVDVHNGLIFNQDNNSNLYDILILGHSEYVTQNEYSNFKKFVENGGVVILLDANTFYAEVDYDPLNNKVTLVKGHYWAFDGEKAWRDVKERWADETTDWAGSNFGCSSCIITFNNNPFSYTHHEENYLTNPNARILIDYQAQSEYNYLIAAYELQYGLGKVVSLSIFGSDVAGNNNFVQFYKDILATSV